MINEAIRAIIDLLKIKKEVQKTDLEIEKLGREKKDAESLIKIASLEDIKKYDPKARKVERIARAHEGDTYTGFKDDRSRRRSLFAGELLRWILLVAVVMLAAYMYAS